MSVYELFLEVWAFYYICILALEYVMSMCASLYEPCKDNTEMGMCSKLRKVEVPVEKNSNKPSAQVYMDGFAGSLGLSSCPAYLIFP